MVQSQQNIDSVKAILNAWKVPVIVLLIATFTFALAESVSVAQENYCKDPKSWQEWDALVKKYPSDMDIQFLHALRLGLCVKIERGDITLNQAIDIFDRYHDAVVRKKNGEKGEGDIQGL